MNHKKIFLVTLFATTLLTTTKAKAMETTVPLFLGALTGFLALKKRPQQPNEDLQELLVAIKANAIKKLSDDNTDKKNSIKYKNQSIEKFGKFLAQAYGTKDTPSLLDRMKQSENRLKKTNDLTFKNTQQIKEIQSRLLLCEQNRSKKCHKKKHKKIKKYGNDFGMNTWKKFSMEKFQEFFKKNKELKELFEDQNRKINNIQLFIETSLELEVNL